MTDLPLLNGLRWCVACGLGFTADNDTIPAMVYCDKPNCVRYGPRRADMYLAALGDKPRDHMHRACPRCRYEWCEEVLQRATPDAPSPQQAPLGDELLEQRRVVRAVLEACHAAGQDAFGTALVLKLYGKRALEAR